MDILKQNDKMIINSLSFQEVSTYQLVKQNALNVIVEINIFDADTNFLIETVYAKLPDLSNKIILFNDFPNTNDGQIIIETEDFLRSRDYVTGNFNVSYKFYTNILGTNDTPLILDKISPTRTEISVKSSNDTILKDLLNFTNKYFYQFSPDFEFNKFTNFGANRLSLVLNSKNEFNATTNLNTVILKLYQALSTDFVESASLWVVQLYSDEIIDSLTLLPPIAAMFNGVNILQIPNQTLPVQNVNRTFNKLENENDILANSMNFGNLFEPLIKATSGSSLYGIELNTDYSLFSNFIHFGSAAQLLDNLKKKITQIQFYETQSQTPSVAYSDSSSIFYKNKKQGIINEFTRYERFSYFTTGSFFTSSLVDNGLSQISPYNTFTRHDGTTGNLIISSTWPKIATTSGSGFPFILADVNGVTASAWFNLITSESLIYDFDNRDYLLNMVPEYLRIQVDANIDYITFINMIGEFYDNIWVYINSFYTLLKRENKLSDTLPNELIWNILKNNGIEINQSHDVVDLGEYLFGLYPSGSSTNFTVATKTAQKQISIEIWNRLLNNLPYLFKSKGTKKSIVGLLNAYGIPRDLLTIREFGGPYSSSFSGSFDDLYNQKYEFVVDDFTHVVNFSGSQRIEIPWVTSSFDNEVPDTIELKFRTTNIVPTMSLFEKISRVDNAGFSVKLYNTLRDMGYLKLEFTTGSLAASSSVFPFYNGAYYNVFITRDEANESLFTDTASLPQNYRLFVKRFDEDTTKILIDFSSSISITGSNTGSYNPSWYRQGVLKLGGTSSYFVGSMDEFRLWSEQLEESVMDWHASYWPATNGNTFTSSISSLQFRLTFNSASDLGASFPGTASMLNEAYTTQSYYASASAINFTNLTSYPFNFSFYERSSLVQNNFVAPDMITSEKIRLENNSVSQSITLPDGYVVTPLRLPAQSDFQNFIFDKSTQQFAAIEGEQNPFKDTDPDTDKLLIGFAPAQLINNDMIAFYGNTNLLSSIGDPLNIYEDFYPPIETTNNFYWNHTKNKVTFFDYIRFIRTYDKNLFEQILKFVPAQATTMMGTVYEPTMIHRNRIRLMHPETAFDYDYGTAVLTGSNKNITLNGDIEDIEGKTHIATSFKESAAIAIQKTHGFKIPQETNGNFIAVNDTLLESSKAKFILSPFNSPKATVNAIPEQLSGKFQDLSGDYDYKLNPWNLKNEGLQSVTTNIFSSIFMRDTISTSAGTPDNRPVIEITKNSSKQLKVNFSSNPKLVVE